MSEIRQNVLPWKYEPEDQAEPFLSRGAEAVVSGLFIISPAEHFEEARAFSQSDKAPMTLTFTGNGVPGLEEFMTGLVEAVVRTNVRLAEEILRAESPRAFAKLQQRFLCEWFDAIQQGAAVLAHAAGHAARRRQRLCL